MTNGDITHYELFHHLPQCFQKSSVAKASKSFCFWERVLNYCFCFQLGQLSYKQGRLDEALGYYLQDLKVTRGEVGNSHPRMATVLNEIALVYDDKNDEMAGKLYETALMIILETFGPNYLGTGTIR